MKTQIDSEIPTCAVERCVRENPTYSILIAAGVGIGLGLLLRALQPTKDENRAERLISDLRQQIRGIAEPAYDRASAITRSGMEQINDLNVGGTLCSLRKRFQSFFR